MLPDYHSSVSLVRIPDRKYDFYTELNHVCLEERDKGISERQKFLTMHPLKYGINSQGESDEEYWPHLGLKDSYGNDVLGKPTFRPIYESSSYKWRNRTIYFHGNTLLPQCFWHSNSPGHWIFPMSAIFELGRKKPKTIFPQFDRLALMKCPNWQGILHQWEWGQLTLEAALDPLVERGLFLSYNHSANASWPLLHMAGAKNIAYPLPHIFSSVRHATLTPPLLVCFESLHVISRWGVTSNSTDDVNTFRQSVLKAKMKKNKKSRKDIMNSPLSDASVSDRCRDKSLRVVLHLRRKGSRTLINDDEIVTAIKKYTNEVSKNYSGAPAMEEQILLYNSYDILVSPPGSHLVNMIFTNRTRVAVIEIGLAVRDTFWRENSLRIGINNYYYSMAGSDGDEQCYKENKMDKGCKVQADGQTVICPLLKNELWNAIGDCSFTLNTTVFEAQLKNAIRNICKE